MRSLPTLLSLATLACMMVNLPGCVFEKINDQLAVSNAGVAKVEARLDRMLEEVDETNRRLEETQARLAALESINRSLQSIDASLKRLDDHLMSLRSTISNIDDAIPFLKFSAEKEAPGQQPAPTPAPDRPAPQP